VDRELIANKIIKIFINISKLESLIFKKLNIFSFSFFVEENNKNNAKLKSKKIIIELKKVILLNQFKRIVFSSPLNFIQFKNKLIYQRNIVNSIIFLFIQKLLVLNFVKFTSFIKNLLNFLFFTLELYIINFFNYKT
jgi:hypothetical protein